MRSSRLLLLVAASAVALITAAPAQARQVKPSDPWAQATSDVPVDSNVRFGILPNGMRYAVMHNATPPQRASFRLRIDAGSLMENEQQLGLAHFMEHMAFNGTTHVPENDLLAILERLGLAFGADTNAFTSFDQTAYVLEIPRTNDETVDTALHIMREQVSEALMAPKAIDEERGVVAGEERLRNTPDLRAGRAQLKLLAPGQRLSQRMPIGDLEIIRTAPRERFVDFYNRYYRPSRATFIAVGDFDVDIMERKIRAAFQDWAPKAPDGGEPDLGQSQPRQPQTALIVERGLQSSVSLSWTSPPEHLPDTLAHRRKDTIDALGLAVLNRRFAEMSRTDDPPFINAQTSASDLFQSLHVAAVQAAFLPGKWKRAVETIDQEQRRLVQFGVSDEELQREISTWRTALENAVAGAATRQTSGLANSLLGDVNENDVFTSPQTDLDLFNATVKGLTASQVSEAVKTIFTGGGPLTMVMSPEPIQGGEAAVTAALAASHQVAVAALPPLDVKTWPYTDFGAPGTVASRRELAELGATEVVFANGVKLLVKQTDFSKDSIGVQISTGRGEQAFASNAFDPRQSMIGGLGEGGLGRLTVDETSRALTGHTYGGGLATGEDRFILGGGTRREDLQLEMQYLAANLTDPAYRSNPYERSKAQYPAVLALSRATPAGAFGLYVGPLLADGDKRKAIVPPETVATWSVEPYRDQLKGLISDGPLNITMVGDLTVDEAIGVTATTFGALPPRPPRAPIALTADRRVFPASTPKPLQFKHEGLAGQALGFVAWPTTDAGDDRTEARRINLLSEVLKLRALAEIRERLALAYSPGVGAQFSEVYKNYGYISIKAETAPDKIDAFYAAVDRITAGLRDKPISQDELNRVREPVLAAARRSRANNGWWLSQLASVNEHPKYASQVLDNISDLEAVTPADIQALARRYLKPSTAWRATITAGKAPAIL